MTAKIKNIGPRGNYSYKHKPRGISDRAFAKVYWPYLPVVLIAGVLLSMGAQAGAIQAAVTKHHGKVLDYATSMSISGLLSDTNTARAQNGVAGLNLNGKLDAAAQAQANDMAARNYWSHDTPEGNPPWVWVSAQGYSYQALGQNLAAGFSDEQNTVDGWMASPEHRTNMLNPVYTDVGFGSANNANYTSAGGGPMTIVVAFYGEPTPSAPAPATVPAAPVSSPPATPTPSSTPADSVPASSAPAAAASPPSGNAAAAKDSAGTSKPAAKNQPETTQTPSHGVTLAYRTSRAQIAFAKLPQSSFATGFVVLAAFVAVGLFISRHLLSLRRVLVYGESFAIRHPLMDVGLLTIAAISFMMSQTAGFIL